MNKIIITLLFAIGACSLLGCNQHSQMLEQSLQPMQQSYQGVLPCADCGGLETSLFLDHDGTFVLQEIYLGSRDGDQAFAQYGKWQRTADKLVLTNAEGEKRYFRPEGKNIKMMDITGLPIKSTLNYQLMPGEPVMPQTPMLLKGMYVYMADAATFTDCATGRDFPVKNNLELETGYLKKRKNFGEPIFLTLNGYFSVEPSQEEGQSTKILIPNGAIQFDATKSCDSK